MAASLPFKVKAVYEYTSEHDDDLTFPIGQVITVTELEGDDWYVGEYTAVTGEKHEGLFPSNFVEKYEPEVPTRPSRPARARQEAAQPAKVAETPAIAQREEEELPTMPLASTTTASPRTIEQQPPSASAEPPPAPKPTPAEPADVLPSPAKKSAPPPIAAKSNAFKDRIAAFNQQAAAPIVPGGPGRSQQPSNFIKKPFVAPPPSKNAYVPPPKAETVQKPYVREEDPEIKEREEEDRAAAEAAGLSSEALAADQGDIDEDAPKPMTLKERMALLQQQQQEQAQRRADASGKKKPPQKKPSQSSELAAAPMNTDEADSEIVDRESAEAQREPPQVRSSQERPPQLMSPVPAPPEHEILSDGHEADQSGAGDLSDEEDSGTLEPDKNDGDDRPPISMRPPPGYREPVESEEPRDVADAEDEQEDEEVDEETRRKEELRARMARLGGGMPGMGAPFNPFGAPPPAPIRKKAPATDRDGLGSALASSPPQSAIPQMVPVPVTPRMQSPESDATQRRSRIDLEAEDADDQQPELPSPPKRTSTIERSAPPVPRGKTPSMHARDGLLLPGDSMLRRSVVTVG